MAGKIKKIAKNVAEGALNVATLGAYGAVPNMSRGARSCRKKGGKWVKGKCVTSGGPKGPLLGPDGIGRKERKRPDITSTRPKTRKGRKKYPGTGDWYPEKG